MELRGHGRSAMESRNEGRRARRSVPRPTPHHEAQLPRDAGVPKPSVWERGRGQRYAPGSEGRPALMGRELILVSVFVKPGAPAGGGACWPRRRKGVSWSNASEIPFLTLVPQVGLWERIFPGAIPLRGGKAGAALRSSTSPSPRSTASPRCLRSQTLSLGTRMERGRGQRIDPGSEGRRALMGRELILVSVFVKPGEPAGDGACLSRRRTASFS